MEEIEYRGELIHKFEDGTILAYTMNPDGDIDETQCKSIEHAQKVIDNHIEYMAECGITLD